MAISKHKAHRSTWEMLSERSWRSTIHYHLLMQTEAVCTEWGKKRKKKKKDNFLYIVFIEIFHIASSILLSWISQGCSPPPSSVFSGPAPCSAPRALQKSGPQQQWLSRAGECFPYSHTRSVGRSERFPGRGLSPLQAGFHESIWSVLGAPCSCTKPPELYSLMYSWCTSYKHWCLRAIDSLFSFVFSSTPVAFYQVDNSAV